MDFAKVITQIKTSPSCSFFGGRVTGAANIDVLTTENTSSLAAPCAFVVPLESRTDSPNKNMTGEFQVETERFAVVVKLDNSVDRLGLTALLQINDIKFALHQALLNYPFESDRSTHDGVSYVGMTPPVTGDVNRALFFVQYIYELSGTVVTQSDGWTPNSILFANVVMDVNIILENGTSVFMLNSVGEIS